MPKKAALLALAAAAGAAALLMVGGRVFPARSFGQTPSQRVTAVWAFEREDPIEERVLESDFSYTVGRLRLR